MKKSNAKLYVVRKYIKATSAAEALRLEPSHKPDDVWVDDDWKRLANTEREAAIGFMASSHDDEDEE